MTVLALIRRPTVVELASKGSRGWLTLRWVAYIPVHLYAYTYIFRCFKGEGTKPCTPGWGRGRRVTRTSTVHVMKNVAYTDVRRVHVSVHMGCINDIFSSFYFLFPQLHRGNATSMRTWVVLLKTWRHRVRTFAGFATLVRHQLQWLGRTGITQARLAQVGKITKIPRHARILQYSLYYQYTVIARVSHPSCTCTCITCIM